MQQFLNKKKNFLIEDGRVLQDSLEEIGLIMGINPFLQMANTMSNTTGDIAASLIVARSEGLLDLEIYNSR